MPFLKKYKRSSKKPLKLLILKARVPALQRRPLCSSCCGRTVQGFQNDNFRSNGTTKRRLRGAPCLSKRFCKNRLDTNSSAVSVFKT